MKDKTVVSWNWMIKGYISHERSHDCLSLFNNMKLEGFKVDSVTIINVLPACVNIRALEQVKYLHGFSVKSGLKLDSFLEFGTPHKLCQMWLHRYGKEAL